MKLMNNPELWKRTCPKCSILIQYNTYIAYYKAKKYNRVCKKCGIEKHAILITGRKMSDEFKINRSEKYKGSGNPFYGKHHTEESKKKYVESRKKSYSNSKYKTEEFRKKQSILNSGKSNFFYGKSQYDVLVEKYGEDIAKLKFDEINNRRSFLLSGEKNPMYGKPSPQGSGNGWSGWYNGWYFRSLKELSYMISVIERFNMMWESAENKKYRIKYINWEGKQRTYFPDFIINNKYIVEIKPKSLWNSPDVIRKKKYAVEWCKQNGYIYKIVEPKTINFDKIIELYNTKKIIFIKKYEEKFKRRFLNEK